MQNKPNSSAIQSFATEPIPKLVLKNCIPALIAMVMVMIYNLADVFFIGLTHDDLQVAAVSLGSPVFMIFMSLGTLFGVGGTSVVSRALGSRNEEYAKHVSSFCMWSCVAVGLFFMLLLWSIMGRLPQMLGASEDTLAYTRSYLSIVITSGMFTMLSACFSSLIRTEGAAMKAMTGSLIGNLLNIILDPIMILWLRWGITGAAVATVIGNCVSAAYYLLHFVGGKSILSIHPRHFSMKNGIVKAVLSIGISASLSNLLVSVSSIVVNTQLAQYDDMYVAGYGVTSKVMLIIILIGIGVGSGVQPLVGYFYGAGAEKRLKHCLRFSAAFGAGTCLLAAVLCYIFAEPLVRIFLTNESAFQAGIHFTRILMSTAWLIGAFAICQNSLQAMGAATPALLSSILRQAVIFLPAVFLMKALLGIEGLLWAQPIADVLSLVIVFVMLLRKLKLWEKKLHKA